MNPPKHLGAQNWYELYLLKDQFDREAWHKILLGISQYIGFLKQWKLMITIDNSTVRYFIGTNKDVGLLSNNLEGVVLRPISPENISLPSHSGRERLISFVGGGNILDLREKYQVKRSKVLSHALFTIRTINP